MHPLAKNPPPDQSPLTNSSVGMSGARSLTTAFYARVRDDILHNRLQQNEKLPLAQLQERFGVSLSVVREGLSRLVADGLVVAEAQRGFRVSPISRKDLLDITQTRIRIEGMAIERAIECGTPEWIAHLESLMHDMTTMDRSENFEHWGRLHTEFHRGLLAPCDSAWLMRFRDILFEQSERYRYLYASINRNEITAHPRNVDDEHFNMFNAVRQRKPEQAKAALEQHFNSTTQAILNAIQID